VSNDTVATGDALANEGDDSVVFADIDAFYV